MGTSCCKKRQMLSSKYGELLIGSNNDSTKKSIPGEKVNICVNDNDIKDDLSVNSLSVHNNRTYSFEKGHKLVEENIDKAETYIRINRNIFDRNNSFYSTIGNDIDNDKKQVTINSKTLTSINKEIPDIIDNKKDLNNNLQTFGNPKESISLVKTLPNLSEQDFNDQKNYQQSKESNQKYSETEKDMNENLIKIDNFTEVQVININNNYENKEIQNRKDFSEEEELFDNKDDKISNKLSNLDLNSDLKEENTENFHTDENINNELEIITNKSLKENNPDSDINKYNKSNENDNEFYVKSTSIKNNDKCKDETFHQKQNELKEENHELTENTCIISNNLTYNVLVNVNEESKLEKCDTNIHIVQNSNHNLKENISSTNDNSSTNQGTFVLDILDEKNNKNLSANNNNSYDIHNNENGSIVNNSENKENFNLNEDNENSK
jgi:hypothetical protein